MAAMDCETALSAELSLAMRNETLDLEDLTSGTSSASSDISSLSACLDLDTTALPRLDDFSSVEEALSSPLDALPPLPASLSHSLSPRIPEPTGTPSNSSISACNSPEPSTELPLSPQCCSAAAAVPELSARLRAACCETSALRARVAELTRENRSLRASLVEASSKPPLLVGLAHVSADVAGAISTALSLGTANVTANNVHTSHPPSKKRKRAAAGKTLACLVLLAGFFFGSPGMLRDGDSTHSTDPALPTPWGSRNSRSGSQRSSAVAEVRVRTPPVHPSNCIRPLEALPPGTPPIVKEELVMEDTEKKINVNGAGARVVEMHDAQKEKFSYVLCRDSRAAVQNAKDCGRRIQGGEQCSRENSITLIMPAAAVGLERDDGEEEFAEVHCNIVRVARIPPAAATKKNAPHFGGRVVATVPDRMQ